LEENAKRNIPFMFYLKGKLTLILESLRYGVVHFPFCNLEN
jgi:hypothetical protein